LHTSCTSTVLKCVYWSIGVIVTFVPVTDKPSERNRDGPQ